MASAMDTNSKVVDAGRSESNESVTKGHNEVDLEFPNKYLISAEDNSTNPLWTSPIQLNIALKNSVFSEALMDKPQINKGNDKKKRIQNHPMSLKVVKKEPETQFGNWHLLPDLLLEQIFSYLTIIERYNVSQVCRSWYEAFYFPRVWYTFTLYDGLLTKRKFNYYSGWEKLLDHLRATIFLTNKGHHIRTLIFQPMVNLFNLYEFLNIAYFMHQQLPGCLEKVHTLRFHFSCQVAQRSEEQIFYGTGGQILIMLKRVMSILTNLQTLELTDLLLESSEGLQLLDEVCISCCETLQTLILINTTKLAQTLLHPGTFINLQILVISPQNIGEDLLELLGHTKLRNMHVVQNKLTEQSRSMCYKAWKTCCKNNSRLRVHLRVEGNAKQEIILQPGAPVKSVIYDSSYSKISTTSILQIVELYENSLEIYGHKRLPRYYMPRSFHDRIDSSLLLLARQCPYIHTLVTNIPTLHLVDYSKRRNFYFSDEDQ